MRIRKKSVRNLCSILFSCYYLICAEQADEKVRKIRSVLTVDHLRVAWNKSTSPYLTFATKLIRPRFMRYQPRSLQISRPPVSSYSEPVSAWLYFNGSRSALQRHTRVVLNVPGGGFVAMSPRTHDDALYSWAGETGLPILSLDYKKAPEHPYPYALNECFDVYRMLVESRGRCIGLSGDVVPQIVLSGDSAGGNLAAGAVLMVLQTGSNDTRRWQGEALLPAPAGLVLIYPALDVNIGNWMTDEQMALIRDKGMRNTNKRILSRKISMFGKLSPGTPVPSDDEDEPPTSPPRISYKKKKETAGEVKATSKTAKSQGHPLMKTRIATSSMISYVSDRVLTPEMMRAMIILYVGPHARPDFSTDYLLSPILAPEQLLARFPKTYFLTGERDPLVDDTAIMAGRIRAAKRAAWKERAELGALTREEKKKGWREHDHAEVCLLEGISHGFIQMATLYPPAWRYISKVGRWYVESFERAEDAALQKQPLASPGTRTRTGHLRQQSKQSGNLMVNGSPHTRNHNRTATASSAEDDNPLEIGSGLRLSRRTGNMGHKLSATIDGQGEDGEADEEQTVPSSPELAADGLAREHPMRNGKSFSSLASEDDLLARRMRGLVGGLTRREAVDSDDG